MDTNIEDKLRILFRDIRKYEKVEKKIQQDLKTYHPDIFQILIEIHNELLLICDDINKENSKRHEKNMKKLRDIFQKILHSTNKNISFDDIIEKYPNYEHNDKTYIEFYISIYKTLFSMYNPTALSGILSNIDDLIHELYDD